MDNILFGDPFKQHIINFISWRDLYTLRDVCTKFRNIIPKKYVNKFVIKDIKNHLHKLLKFNYDSFKNKYYMMDDYNITFGTIENLLNRYNKYFIIRMKKSFANSNGPSYMSLRSRNMKFSLNKNILYNMQNECLHLSTLNDNILTLIRLDNNITKNDLEKVKSEVLDANQDGQYNLYWFENDTYKLFKLNQQLF